MLALETERLILRDFIGEDWEALNATMIDPEVKRYSYFAFWDGAERREWFAWLVQDVDNQNRDAYSANFVKEEGDNHAIINPATRFYFAPSNT